MAAWLGRCGWDVSKAHHAGRQELRQLRPAIPQAAAGLREEVAFAPPHAGPGDALLAAGDEKLPDSKTCYERAGMNPKVAHTALEDALAVVQLCARASSV